MRLTFQDGRFAAAEPTRRFGGWSRVGRSPVLLGETEYQGHGRPAGIGPPDFA